ncbi:hypothetical protein GN244_ATG07022 [Phytophthora infestans]|uniref:Uncharacterized protein n=1 Tax=Phytophthora infestans TaxID=4787 RepID=A0A833SX74_PHYIN|nr:hypothetical protein GN244_ATG07022 [Phytophthora infestans]
MNGVIIKREQPLIWKYAASNRAFSGGYGELEASNAVKAVHVMEEEVYREEVAADRVGLNGGNGAHPTFRQG